MFTKFSRLMIFTIFIMGISAAQDAVAPKKSDLVIDQLDIKVLKEIPKEGKKVRVVVVVKNISSYPTFSSLTADGQAKCPKGCFIVRLNVLRNYPSGSYAQLCERKCGPLRGNESYTFYCDDFVKSGTESKYQALADFLNWIDEANEGNNEKTTSIR